MHVGAAYFALAAAVTFLRYVVMASMGMPKKPFPVASSLLLPGRQALDDAARPKSAAGSEGRDALELGGVVGWQG